MTSKRDGMSSALPTPSRRPRVAHGELDPDASLIRFRSFEEPTRSASYLSCRRAQTRGRVPRRHLWSRRWREQALKRIGRGQVGGTWDRDDRHRRARVRLWSSQYVYGRVHRLELRDLSLGRPEHRSDVEDGIGHRPLRNRSSCPTTDRGFRDRALPNGTRASKRNKMYGKGERRHAPGSPGLAVVRTEPGLLVRPWKPCVPATALVADTVPPEVLPGLSQTDAVSAAFVGWVVELDVVVFPATHGASLESSGRGLSERLVAAAGARMLDGACRDGAPVGLALCHHEHDDSPGRGLKPYAMYAALA
jgi:hypothetical protein